MWAVIPLMSALTFCYSFAFGIAYVTFDEYQQYILQQPCCFLPVVPVFLRWRFSTPRRTEQWSPCAFTPLWSLCSTMRPFLWRTCAGPWRNVWSKLLSLQNTWMTKLSITFSLAGVLLLEGLRFVLCYFGGLTSLPFTVRVSSMLRFWHLCPRV